ncbi:hypothetical protein D3C76_1508090 [compost metagenome]
MHGATSVPTLHLLPPKLHDEKTPRSLIRETSQPPRLPVWTGSVHAAQETADYHNNRAWAAAIHADSPLWLMDENENMYPANGFPLPLAG